MNGIDAERFGPHHGSSKPFQLSFSSLLFSTTQIKKKERKKERKERIIILSLPPPRHGWVNESCKRMKSYMMMVQESGLGRQVSQNQAFIQR
jgi:hypothetical protein